LEKPLAPRGLADLFGPWCKAQQGRRFQLLAYFYYLLGNAPESVDGGRKGDMMVGNGYRIVLLGISPDKDPQEVKQQMGKAFRLTPEKAEQMFSILPVTIRSDVNYPTAMKYQEVISNIGGVCRVESGEEGEHASSLPKKPLQTDKICPNCGYRTTSPDDPLLTAYDGRGECPACGIIVSKFNQARCGPRTEASYQAISSSSCRPKRRSRRFRFGIAAVVLAGLAIFGFAGQFAMRKIAMYRFCAQVEAYDRKPRSLASVQEANQAIEDLYRLYDAVPESMPGFMWDGFNPEGKFGKFYTRDDLETIDGYLRPRKDALIKDMRDATPNGEILFGLELEDIGENLRQYEFCVIRRLEPMDKDCREQMDLLGMVSGIDCDQVVIGPLSGRMIGPEG
jgi:hypothetical protein